MPISMAARSRRAQGRVQRRYLRLIKRKEPLTHEHLVGELMISQIDATLAVSHAIQEGGQQSERLIALLEDAKWRMEPPPFGAKAKMEAHIGAMEQDIRQMVDEIVALKNNVAVLAKQVMVDIVQPVARASPPWWQEAEWFGWLLLLIFVIVVWFIIMYNFDSFVRWFGGEVSAYRVLI